MAKNSFVFWCFCHLSRLIAYHLSPTHVSPRWCRITSMLPMWGAHFSLETADLWGLGMEDGGDRYRSIGIGRWMEKRKFLFWKNFEGRKNTMRWGEEMGFLEIGGTRCPKSVSLIDFFKVLTHFRKILGRTCSGRARSPWNCRPVRLEMMEIPGSIFCWNNYSGKIH